MRLLAFSALAASSTLLFAGCASPSPTDVAAGVSPSSTVSSSSSPSSSSLEKELAAKPVAPKQDSGLASSETTTAQLKYLIEEEKLAHDIYSAMFDLWGARVFGNILNSEQSHQNQVLTVMQKLDVKDPRSTKAGVFVNQELQKLYDQLLAKGKTSETAAFEVGVAIEELDIKDLSEMLSTAKDPDVIAMMENLRGGSENHLRAFNNQL